MLQPSDAALDRVRSAAVAIPGISGIHVLGHGKPGQIRRGAEVRDSGFINARAGRFAALRADGSVVPWGVGFDDWLTVQGTAQPLLDGTIDVVRVYSSYSFQYESFAACGLTAQS